MAVVIDAGWVVTILLIATRLAGVLLLAPVLSFAVLPPLIRVLFVLTFSLSFAALPGLKLFSEVLTFGSILRAAILEFMLGAMMAFGLHAAVASVAFAGQLLDVQIGFGAATLFDPNTHVQSPVTSVLFGMVGALLFLVLDLHLELVRALSTSFVFVPPGTPTPLNVPGVLISQFGGIFIYGIVIAAPVVLGLLLVDVTVSVISRAMPQVNIYFVTLPLKVFVGLLLLFLTLGQALPAFRRAFANVFASWPGH